MRTGGKSPIMSKSLAEAGGACIRPGSALGVRNERHVQLGDDPSIIENRASLLPRPEAIGVPGLLSRTPTSFRAGRSSTDSLIGNLGPARGRRRPTSQAPHNMSFGDQGGSFWESVRDLLELYLGRSGSNEQRRTEPAHCKPFPSGRTRSTSAISSRRISTRRTSGRSTG